MSFEAQTCNDMDKTGPVFSKPEIIQNITISVYGASEMCCVWSKSSGGYLLQQPNWHLQRLSQDDDSRYHNLTS